MTLGRLLATSCVLAALSILLTAAARAQGNCCECIDPYGGADCSACCYPDQTPVCGLYSGGSFEYCGCNCVSGPGGGIGGCGSTRLASRTFVLGAEGGPRLASHQLRFGILHPGDRREGFFDFEEWALVSSAGGKAQVLNASTAEFRDRVQGQRGFSGSREAGAPTTLVVAAAEHPHNSREIPVPELAPIDFDAGLPASAAGQVAWFRAEVGEDGVVDHLMLLNRPYAFALGSIGDRLRDHLSLHYADKRRHRVVVFGAVRADASGHLSMTSSWVILPTCCCGGAHCV